MPVKRMLIGLALLTLFCSSLQAQTVYIDDTLYAPVRSGEGSQYRIIHRGLRSGTQVEILEQEEGSDYARIRYGDDREGYILTRYLSRTPIAADRLAQANAELETLRQRLADREAELEQAQSESSSTDQRAQALEQELSETQEELERITALSEDAIQLDRRNTELREAKQELEREVELLATENQRLQDRRDSDFMLIGGGLVFGGVLIAVILPMLKPSKRQSDTWA